MIYYVTATQAGESPAWSVQTLPADLLEIKGPGDAVIVVHSISVSQSSEAGDAESEQVTIEVVRVTSAATSGSGGLTITPTPRENGGAAAGGTYEAFNTTALTGGSESRLAIESFNVMNGLPLAWPPEERPVLSTSQFLLVRLIGDSDLNDAVSFQVTAVVEELGG